MPAEPVVTAEKPVSIPPPASLKAPTPRTWRIGIACGILALGGLAYVLRDLIGPRGQAVVGVFCFFGLVAMFSSNLHAVNWRTIGWGFALQIILAPPLERPCRCGFRRIGDDVGDPPASIPETRFELR